MDHFRQISTFVEVVARGSLSAAARAEGIAPAMIGRRLDALEARLGVKLLQRTTRKLVLTDEGAAFLEDCQRILAELEEAEAAVSERSARATGHLLVSAPAGFGRQHVAPLVPSFLAEHRDVTLNLNLNDRVVDVIGEGVDVAIRIASLSDSSLVGVKLADNHRVVVGAPAYLKRHGTPQTLADLARHNCLAISSEGSQRGWTFREDGKNVTVKVGGQYGVQRRRRAARLGAGRHAAWPGVRCGKWAPKSRRAGWCRCWSNMPRRATISMRCLPSAAICRCASAPSSISCATPIRSRTIGASWRH